MLKVGDRIVRTIPAKYKVKNAVRTGVIVALEYGHDNNNKKADGYRIKFDDENENDNPFWYAAKGDFIEKE